MRPDIVWFDEMPYQMERIDEALRRCGLFVSIGTSGAVYPAAGFVQTARYCGAQTLEFNLEPSQGSVLRSCANFSRAWWTAARCASSSRSRVVYLRPGLGESAWRNIGEVSVRGTAETSPYGIGRVPDPIPAQRRRPRGDRVRRPGRAIRTALIEVR